MVLRSRDRRVLIMAGDGEIAQVFAARWFVLRQPAQRALGGTRCSWPAFLNRLPLSANHDTTL